MHCTSKLDKTKGKVLLPKKILMIIVLLALTLGLAIPPDALLHSILSIENKATATIKFSQVSMEYQYQNITHNGDLLINNNETMIIANSTFYMNGTITVKDTSTLIVKSSKFTAAPFYETGIALEDHARLVIMNTTMIFRQLIGFAGEISARNDSRIIFENVNTENRGFIMAYDNAMISVNTSKLVYGTLANYDEGSGVVTFDKSTARMDNSTINGAFIWDNSTTSISNSSLGIIRSTWKGSERTTINVTNSRIDTIEITSGIADLNVENSEIRTITFNGGKASFLRTSVGKLESYGKSEVTFIDSSYGPIEPSNETSVLIGWHLPLIGLVIVPYEWIPLIQEAAVLLVLVAIIITALVIWRARRKDKQEQDPITDQAAQT